MPYRRVYVNDDHWELEQYNHIQRAPFEGHYANRNEAKALRRIMSQTGLTEAEVRSIKKYRKILSDAQKGFIARM